MTFPQLQYLLEIYRTGSVTKAAQSLFVTQSSVSIALGALEKELGFPIFLRTKKGLQPTQKGIHVIEQASQIWNCHQQMLSPALQEGTRIRISSVSLEPVQKAFLQLIRENQDRQDILFSLLREGDSRSKLKSFHLEAAITLVLSPHLLSILDNAEKMELESRVLCDIPCMLRIGKGHRLFDTDTISPKDLEQDFFMDTPGSTVSDALLKAGILRVNKDHSIRTHQHTLRKQGILDGLAYEVVHVFPSQLQDPNYRCIPLEGFSYKLVLTTNPLRPPIPELDRFFELLNEELCRAGAIPPQPEIPH